MGIEEHRNTSKKQKTVQPTSFPWNHSNILSLSEIHADSFPVPLKQFSLQWNSLSSGGILSLQLQPTASLAGHSRLNSREAGNMKSWPDFNLNVMCDICFKQDSHLQIVDTSVDRGVASVPCVNLSDYGQPEEQDLIVVQLVAKNWCQLMCLQQNRTSTQKNDWFITLSMADLGWRLARPPGGREEQPVVNWEFVDELYCYDKSVISPQKFHRPARTPSFRPQWARRARWRTWGSRDSPWCSPAWAQCTSRSPPAWTQGPGLHTGVSSSKNMRLNTTVTVKHKLKSPSSINLIRCKGTKPVHGENCVEACPQRFQLAPNSPVFDKSAKSKTWPYR